MSLSCDIAPQNQVVLPYKDKEDCGEHETRNCYTLEQQNIQQQSAKNRNY